MVRHTDALSRRHLIKTFGLSALLIHPVLRSMAYAAPTPYEKAPRYLMVFKGGSYYPSRTNPSAITDLAGTPIAALQPHARDLILFKNMNIHGGSPKSDGYKEEHAAGVIGCSTGNSYKYSKNDSYFAYTDNESISPACTSAAARIRTPIRSASAIATSRSASARRATPATATRSSRSRTRAKSTTS